MNRWYTRAIVPVANVQRSVDFYARLGFREDWRHAEANDLLVAQVSRQGCELLLSCQWPDRNGSALTTTTKLIALFKITASSAAKRNKPIRNGKRNSAPPRPISPPSEPTPLPTRNASNARRSAILPHKLQIIVFARRTRPPG